MKRSSQLLLSLIVNFTFLSLQSYSAEDLIAHVKDSIAKAEEGISKLIPSTLRVEGYSSSKIKHFLNNLCSLPESRYLEIGVYKGSTFVAALYGNTSILSEAIAIDNWSEFGNNHGIFTSNTAIFLPENSFRFYSHDSFSINLEATFPEPITIYFYDGNHSFESQRKAFTYYNPILADTFIAIVDDWNWENVQNGTKQAFKDLEYNILFEAALPARYNADIENWWNGLYVAVIQKPMVK